jgi:peptidoglycan hydrolase-like protein with peptidoglycan-binding domain
MFANSKAVWTKVVFSVLMTGILAVSLTPLASAAQSKGGIKAAQQALLDKGYNPGQVDGKVGPQTRQAIGQYQKAENLPVTQHLDTATAGKLGVEPESVGGDFKTAGKDVGEGGEQLGKDVKKGKPITAGKDFGQAVGSGAKKVGVGVKKAVTP